MNIVTSLLRHRTVAVCAALSLFVGMGCASGPPSSLKAQLIQTDASIAQAEQAGAAQAALPELQQAKDKRVNAEEALHDRKYDSSMQFARQAQVDAQYASRKSEAVRAAKSATEVERGHDTLREETERKSDAQPTVPTDDKRFSEDR